MKDFELDNDRHSRLGFPEIVYGEFKSAIQLKNIIADHNDRQKNILVTRLQEDKAKMLLETFNSANYDPLAKTFSTSLTPPIKHNGLIGLISAGTSDAGVVKEVANTLTHLGYEFVVFNDIGVAGMHRLMDKKEALKDCDIIIAVAGFEGALPSVVGGIFPQPIIAVPTSVGYGVALGGTTALHAMLTSCANGILVTNIDNGCGAALSAVRILNAIYKGKE
jgi:NCAIR mutase (PurE)-related protein